MRRRAALLLAVLVALYAWGPQRLPDWLGSPDQQAQRHYNRGAYREAAALFTDPLRRGNAWYRAGDFARAAAAYALASGPNAAFNRGNALLMGGDYGGAMDAYDRALLQVPGWYAPATNRAIAEARLARLAAAGAARGEVSGVGADAVRFDAEAGSGGSGDAAVASGAIDDAALRALWLRQVSTRPGDFLARRFAAQLAAAGSAGAGSR